MQPMKLPPGFACHVGSIGIKDDSGADDLLILAADRRAAAAGVFTNSLFAGPSVQLSRAHIACGHAQAVVVVSKNANVATGERGKRDAVGLAQRTAQFVGCDPGHVLVGSTGVIGVPYPVGAVDAYFDGLDDLLRRPARAHSSHGSEAEPNGAAVAAAARGLSEQERETAGASAAADSAAGASAAAERPAGPRVRSASTGPGAASSLAAGLLSAEQPQSGLWGDDALAAAVAIMTTDTRPKTASASIPATVRALTPVSDSDGAPNPVPDGVSDSDGAPNPVPDVAADVAGHDSDGMPKATVVGIAKGSGMIEPDMATMISLIVTDAQVPPDRLDAMLRRVCDVTFNALSVDTDTSTSDMVVMLAGGAAGPVDETQLEAALGEVCLDLTRQLAFDGEGAQTLIVVTVTGARDTAQAKRVAKAIVNSPLVKTAVHGRDPNWGRVAMAVGKCSDETDIDPDKVTIRFGDQEVYPAAVTPEALAALQDYLASEQVLICVDLGIEPQAGCAAGECTVYGCDLTADYVRINADYTT